MSDKKPSFELTADDVKGLPDSFETAVQNKTDKIDAIAAEEFAKEQAKAEALGVPPGGGVTFNSVVHFDSCSGIEHNRTTCRALVVSHDPVTINGPPQLVRSYYEWDIRFLTPDCWEARFSATGTENNDGFGVTFKPSDPSEDTDPIRGCLGTGSAPGGTTTSPPTAQTELCKPVDSISILVTDVPCSEAKKYAPLVPQGKTPDGYACVEGTTRLTCVQGTKIIVFGSVAAREEPAPSAGSGLPLSGGPAGARPLRSDGTCPASTPYKTEGNGYTFCVPIYGD
jgi:hypothetical protein